MTMMPKAMLTLALGAMLMTGCSRRGDIDVENGVGIFTTRNGCPFVEVPAGTGDITLFNPAGSQEASAIDVVASITNVRSNCNANGPKIYAVADFDVLARRSDTRGPRTVTLPYFAVVMQGGSAVVAKRVGEVTLSFADGQTRAQAHAKGAAYIDAAAANLPAEVRERLTRRRKAGDPDAAIDPMSDPEVRAAVARATFELLVGFQLSEDQLRYNATR